MTVPWIFLESNTATACIGFVENEIYCFVVICIGLFLRGEEAASPPQAPLTPHQGKNEIINSV
jgi:hypothetical protein